MTAGTKRWPLVAALLIGLGLAAAPAAFQMFERAPLGGDMIDDFEPYMVQEKIDTFRGYMDLIDAAVTESADLRTAVVDGGSLTAEQYDTQFIFAKKLSRRLDDDQHRHDRSARSHGREHGQLRSGRRAPAVRPVPVVLRAPRR